MNQERVPCNLCGSNDFRVKYQSQNDYTPHDLRHYAAATDMYGGFGQVVVCSGCALTYTNPRLPAGEVLEHYQAQEDSEFAGEDASRSINAYFSLNTIQRFVQKGDLLDVGSAAGYFLNAARLNFNVQGVEPGRQSAEFAHTQLRLNVHNGTLASAKFSDQSFDVVALSDVIEHFSDPLAELREIHRITRPGGLVYVLTPNIQSFMAQLMGARWWGLRPAHLYYFSPKTLSVLLQRAGFEVVLVKSYGRVFRLSYWASRLKNYSPAFTEWLLKRLQRFHLQDKLVYINTLDSMEVCARRLV